MSSAVPLRHADESGGGGGLAPTGAALFRVPAAKLGLWVFMAVVTMLFLLLSLAYLSRAQIDDWQSLAGESWRPLSSPWRLWLNTGLLLASSLALQAARVAARHGQGTRTGAAFGLAGLLGFAFLIGQLTVWQQLAGRGYFVASNPANTFFYLLTALHGLHLLGGLIAWSRSGMGFLRDGLTGRNVLHIELCSLYWHFLLVVWLGVFALLASPREALDGLASICGLR